MNTLKRLWCEEDAATATEYAIIAAILGVRQKTSSPF
jgi:Flp pilus assembly pilin Flp